MTYYARGTVNDRFEAKVNTSGECWLWIGHCDPKGYGDFYIGGGKRDKAHRFAFTRNGGVILVGQQVCHSCDRPPCVRPAHLFAGTPKQNTDDMMRKGRNDYVIPVRFGSAHPGHKVNEQEVLQIRALLGDGFTKSQIARRFKISRSAVRKIATGHTWIWL